MLEHTYDNWKLQAWLAQSIKGMHKVIRRRNSLILLVTMAGWALCHTSNAESVKGSAGAGFQSWITSDLNNNSAPYWEYPTNYMDGSFGGITPPGTMGNVGYCLTGTGNCPQLRTPGPSPGTIPFWAMSYDPDLDTGGALDPKVWFKRDIPNRLKATLELQLSNNANEINEFGWFETDKDGSFVGRRHRLFKGSGSSAGSTTPDPVGTTVSFRPTKYYGYYFLDVSEGSCLVSTLFSFNTPICRDSLPHNFAVFATDPGSRLSSFWIAGLNAPLECQGEADCNLTLVKIQPIPTRNCDEHREHARGDDDKDDDHGDHDCDDR
jgi:hypothetical protein